MTLPDLFQIENGKYAADLNPEAVWILIQDVHWLGRPASFDELFEIYRDEPDSLEYFLGKAENLTVKRVFMKLCLDCRGAGTWGEIKNYKRITYTCPTCSGSGKVPCERYRVKDGVLKYPCIECEGHGDYNYSRPFEQPPGDPNDPDYWCVCKVCDGDGWIPVPEPVPCKGPFCKSGLVEQIVDPDCHFCKGTGQWSAWQERWGDVWRVFNDDSIWGNEDDNGEYLLTHLDSGKSVFVKENSAFQSTFLNLEAYRMVFAKYPDLQTIIIHGPDGKPAAKVERGKV